MTKRYSFVSKTTGKPAKAGSFNTRDEARIGKFLLANRGRKVNIFDNVKGTVIR